jgi:hypothetical protein
VPLTPMPTLKKAACSLLRLEAKRKGGKCSGK